MVALMPMSFSLHFSLQGGRLGRRFYCVYYDLVNHPTLRPLLGAGGLNARLLAAAATTTTTTTITTTTSTTTTTNYYYYCWYYYYYYN